MKVVNQMDSDSPDILEERKKNLFKSVLADTGASDGKEGERFKFLKYLKIGKTNLIYLILLLPILIIAYIIRIGNLSLLKGKYLVGLDDPYFWYRYSLTIVEKGSLPAIDYLRYSPVGFPTAPFSTFTHTLAYMYKFLHIFSSKLTVMQWHIMYPVVISVIAFLFFFLFVRELFGNKIALLSTAFLAVMPAYIFRTSAGFADHEALGMLYLFISLWFFALMWKSGWKKGILFGVLSGLFAGLMASTWGGVKILIAVVSFFVIASIFFSKVNFNQFISYTTWLIAYILFANLFLFTNILDSLKLIYTVLLLVADFILLIFLILSKKEIKVITKLKEKIPLPILSVIITLVIALIVVTALRINLFTEIFRLLTGASGSRFETTVAESMRPYFLYDWWGNFQWLLIFALIGSVYMFYQLFKSSENKKYSLIMSLSSAVFLILFILSRLSGAANYSKIVTFFSHALPYIVIGFVIFTVCFFWYMYIKDRDALAAMFKDNWEVLFMLIFFYVASLIAKDNMRLLFFLAIPLVILAAHFIINFSKDLAAYKNLKYVSYVIIIIAVILFFQMTILSSNLNKSVGSNAPGQWEMYADWLRASTPLNTVVAAWWDYGYWTQTGGERASIGDNGNQMGWNHWLGREAMTGTNPDEYLSYLKTHNATNLMFSREEIGKYHAFSFIGSDDNLDRYSTIGTFVFQEEKEMRNGTRIYYQGGWPLDNDFALGTLIIPEGQGYVIAVSLDKDANNSLTNPTAYLFYNNNQYSVSVKCVCDYEKRMCKEFEYPNNSTYMDACITLTPYYSSDTQVLPQGVAFWTSSKVRYGLFGRLYIQNEELPNFKEVYTDSVPFGIYKGTLIGPIRVWEIEYPAGVKTDSKYLESSIYG